MQLVVLFVVIFIVGPALFWAGLARAPLIAKARVLMLVPAALGFAGWIAKLLAGAAWGQQLWATVPGIALLWLGWIGLLIYCVARVLPMMVTPRSRNMTRALGAIGTTVPWFGLASAHSVVG